jgi:hypothetical protein
MTKVLGTVTANTIGMLFASYNAIELKTGQDCRIILKADEQVLVNLKRRGVITQKIAMIRKGLRKH